MKPIWPIAEYVINYDYIVTNLCDNREKPQLQCDGKCYLSKMIAKESRNDHKNPFAEGQVYQIPITFCPQIDANLDGRDWSLQLSKNPINTSENLHPLLLVFEIIQPPEIV